MHAADGKLHFLNINHVKLFTIALTSVPLFIKNIIYSEKLRYYEELMQHCKFKLAYW